MFVELNMFKRLSLFFCFSLWVSFSHAAPLTWNLDGVTFDDGGNITGSFVFDADSNSVIDWNMSVSGGDDSVFPAFSYTPETITSVGVFVSGTVQRLIFFVDNSAQGGEPDSRLLSLTTDALLTNAGGSVTLLTQISTPQGLFESVECYNCNPFRLIVGGTLNAVPVPNAIWLFGSGLLGLIGVARKKTT
jgi:hypothetical protein